MSEAPHVCLAVKRHYSHDVINHGYDRCVETCACNAKRVLLRECGEPKPTYTKWSLS